MLIKEDRNKVEAEKGQGSGIPGGRAPELSRGRRWERQLSSPQIPALFGKRLTRRVIETRLALLSGALKQTFLKFSLPLVGITGLAHARAASIGRRYCRNQRMASPFFAAGRVQTAGDPGSLLYH
jgi:hypothetical protein